MTVKASYNGKFDFLQLYFGLDFVGQDPVLKTDTKHDRISLLDPDNSKNAIVLDAEHLTVDKDDAITGGTVTDIHFKVDGQEAVTITGLHAPAVKFQAGFDQVEVSLEGLYKFLVNGLSGDVKETGDQFANFFEFGGGGKATINAGDGDDRLYVWHRKDVVYDGGDGSDQLIFTNQVGAAPKDPPNGAVVDLKTGVGTNPYGGDLHVKNVEWITGTNLTDKLYGGNGGETLYGGLNGDDVLMGRGGDDILSAAAAFKGNKITADGGAGVDTLAYDISFAKGVNRLDVTNDDNDTGFFANDKIGNFERYNFNDFQVPDAESHAGIDFVGSGKAETIACSYGDDTFDARGGNDTMSGQFGANLFIFRKGFGDDTITDFGLDTARNTAQFDNSIFADFAAMKAHASQDGFDVVIDAGGDGSLRLKSYDVGDLSSANFTFV